MRSNPLRLVPLSLVLLAACGGGGPTATKESPNPGGGASPRSEATIPNRLVWGTQQEPDKLNPILSDMSATTNMCNLVHGYLVRIDDKMGLYPDLALEVPSLENGGISADYLTYTYKLRKGMKWHDGQPVTSKDVAFTHRIIMDPGLNATTRDIYDKVASVETPDDLTVVFHLKEVFAPFYLAFNDYPVLPEHVLGAKSAAEINKDPYNQHPIGAGPYKLVEWESGSHMRFQAFDGYFRGKPKLEEIHVKFIPEEQVLMVQLQTGEIQYYDNANTTQYEELKKIPGIVVPTTPANTWEHIDLNCDKPILKDPRVRRAIAYGVDKQQISEKVYQGLWKAAYSDQSPLSWAYNKDNETKLVHDPEKAKALLEEAGWKVGGADGIRVKDGQRLTLEISTTVGRPTRERTNLVLKEQLARVGIEVNIKNYRAELFFGSQQEGGILKSGTYDMGMFAWLSPTDPDNYSIFHKDQTPPAGQNSTFWRNDRASQLIDMGRSTVEREKRKEIYRELQAIMSDEVPMVPLLYWVNIDPVTSRLKNFKPNPTRQGNSWNAWEWELEGAKS